MSLTRQLRVETQVLVPWVTEEVDDAVAEDADGGDEGVPKS